MKVEAVLEELKALGDSRAIAVWKKLGMDTSRFYGVGLTPIHAYAKKLGRNHALAIALWDSGIFDARLLATFVADPSLMSEELIDRWVTDCTYWLLTDQFVSELVVKTPFAQARLETWTRSPDDHVRRAGWSLLESLAKSETALANAWFIPYLAGIQRRLQHEENWVKEAMNNALIAIGSRNPALKRTALGVATALGRVRVDYGDASCQAPDAVRALSGGRVQAGNR